MGSTKLRHIVEWGRLYAHALRSIHPRLAPLVTALRDAAASHPPFKKLWLEISNRRRANMDRFAAELIATADMRSDLDSEELADVLWTMGSPELYLLLMDRGWSADRFEEWLAQTWTRLFLKGR